MALTSRKKRPLDRGVEHLGDTRLIIIAAEGHNTEAQYFSLVDSTRVQVKVLATGADHQSAPEYVLELYHFKDEIEDACKCSQVEAWLRDALGGSYNKSRLLLARSVQTLRSGCCAACLGMRSAPRGCWPIQTGSHVYRVFENIPLDRYTVEFIRPRKKREHRKVE